MDLSIIIVNWNTRKVLHDCLGSIRASSHRLTVETFVVDNDSSDDSREMVARDFPEVHLINSGSNMGFGRANNLAIPLAAASYILFINPDTIVNQGMLEKMYTFIHGNPNVGVVSCKIIDETGCLSPLPIQIEATPLKRLFLQFFSSETSAGIIGKIFSIHNPLQSGYVMSLYGACLLIRKKTLEDAGYFDERFFMYAEDVELCQRIYKKGWKLYYMSEVDMIHLCGESSKSAPKAFSIMMMCESISKFMTKDYGIKGAVTYRLGVCLSSFLRLVIILFLLGIDFITGAKKKISHQHSLYKHMIMLKWSLMDFK